MDYTSMEWILQARRLEWVAYPFSRGSCPPRNWTGPCCIAGGFFTNWATGKPRHWLAFTWNAASSRFLYAQGSCLVPLFGPLFVDACANTQPSVFTGQATPPCSFASNLLWLFLAFYFSIFIFTVTLSSYTPHPYMHQSSQNFVWKCIQFLGWFGGEFTTLKMEYSYPLNNVNSPFIRFHLSPKYTQNPVLLTITNLVQATIISPLISQSRLPTGLSASTSPPPQQRGEFCEDINQVMALAPWQIALSPPCQIPHFGKQWL